MGMPDSKRDVAMAWRSASVGVGGGPNSTEREDENHGHNMVLTNSAQNHVKRYEWAFSPVQGLGALRQLSRCNVELHIPLLRNGGSRIEW